MHRLLRSLPCLHIQDRQQQGFAGDSSYEPLRAGTHHDSPAKANILALPSHTASTGPVSSPCQSQSPQQEPNPDHAVLTLETIPETSEPSNQSSSLVKAASSLGEVSTSWGNRQSTPRLEPLPFASALELLENDIARRHRLMMSERQRRHGQAVQPLLVGSRGSYRQQALSSQACSEADSSQISVSGYATAPADMLAALDEARLDAEEEVGRVRKQLQAAEQRLSDLDFARLQADHLSTSRGEELQKIAATLQLTTVQNDVLNRALCRALDDLGVPHICSPGAGTPMPATGNLHAGRAAFPTPDGSIHCGLTPSAATPSGSLHLPGGLSQGQQVAALKFGAGIPEPMPMQSLNMAASPPSSTSHHHSADTAAEDDASVVQREPACVPRCTLQPNSQPGGDISSSVGEHSIGQVQREPDWAPRLHSASTQADWCLGSGTTGAMGELCDLQAQRTTAWVPRGSPRDLWNGARGSVLSVKSLNPFRDVTNQPALASGPMQIAAKTGPLHTPCSSSGTSLPHPVKPTSRRGRGPHQHMGSDAMDDAENLDSACSTLGSSAAKRPCLGRRTAAANPVPSSSMGDARSQSDGRSRWQGMRMSNSPLYEPSLQKPGEGAASQEPQGFQMELQRSMDALAHPPSMRGSGSTTTDIVWSAAFSACSNPTFCPTAGSTWQC
ncbi:hypothetical protein WJX84_002985 [Apatococcus fuscideae]|uniref:Uncharacterized protein n=1 Tax=Apatococcus fuscideae TaxID=2026836 RepID=A0AAW1TIK3_9CHLO